MLNPDPQHAPATAADAPPPGRLLTLALVILALAAATILGALGFEHIGGYQPCALCLEQRMPYYVGVPLAALVVIAVWARLPRAVATALFAAIAVAMLYSAGLAAYHSGVEWGFWEGPEACAEMPAGASAADLLSQLDTVIPASCTEAVWRFLGLSFAGWNVLVSGFLAVLAATAARMAWRFA